MNTTCRKHLAHAVAVCWLSASLAAQAIGVAETPLFISTGATPNVMLLVDNSGSMDNVIWDDGFDPAVSYPDWSPEICGSNNDQECWTPDNGNVQLAQMPRCSGSNFSDDVKGGIRGGVFRCIRLPDAAGGNSTRYNGNYLNYLLETYGQDNVNFVDIRGLIPNSLRIQVARNVASNIVSSNSNLRIGLSSFNPPVSGEGAPGGRINADCGTSTSTLLTRIGNLSSEANTPLAETFYEITRYFRGMTSLFNANTTYTSPIQYRCQKNFVVVVTDGFPTWDTQIPTNDPDDPAGTPSLPNWDGLAPATQASDYPNFSQYSDGFAPDATAAQGEGRTLFLDDLAKFGVDIDLRPSGNDNAGVSFNDPPFQVQNLTSYTVGFAIQNQMLQDAAAYGNGIYLTANNEAQLSSALQNAFRDILARTSSAASVATNSTRLTADTFIYQARFSSADWSGQLLAHPIQADGSIGTPAWDAGSLIPTPATRRLFSYDATAAADSRGIDFEWGDLNTSQQLALNTNAGGTNDGLGEQRLDYLRGDRSNEAPGGSQFRARSTVLGDIVNSDPFFVGKQDYGFDLLPGAEGSSYAAFRAGNASRPGMIYVGANDGKLEAINATSGVEVFAYIPNAVFSKLSLLTAATYNQNHKYLVDGSPRALDAYLARGGTTAWRTVLLGSLGAGGRGVFALDVTDPPNFGTDDVMWEFTNAQDGDMGLSVPQPTIARMNNGKWAAIVANGYNSASQKAMLFVIDIENGSVIRKIDTGVGSDNGLSTPIPVDVDRDRIVDFIYAGDLKGNLWKFDVTSGNANSWDVAFKSGSTPQSLFTACATTGSCTSGNRQPITARPEVSINPTGGFIVYFGTGRYFATGDTTVTSPVNSFYGIFDRNEKGASSPARVGDGRSNLLAQTVLATQTVSDEQVRITSNNTLTNAHKGWFIDLPESGERQVSTPLLRGGRIIFSTLTPSTDPCGFGGTSWLMELDSGSGSRLSASPFDLNDDRQFNLQDFGTYNDVRVPVSGRQSKQGIIKTPGVITAGEIEYKYASGTAGGIDTTIENAAGAGGRQSWRQLQ